LPRHAPNLLANPHFEGRAGWTVRNENPRVELTTYDPALSRTPGSGSVRLRGNNTSIRSGPVPVQPGRTYTFSIYMEAEQQPALAYCMAIILNKSRKELRRVAGDYYGPSRASGWEEMAYLYSARPGEALAQVECGRYEHPYNPNPASPIWLDDAYFGEGVSLEQPASPKRPFAGAAVRVDGLGNFEVNRGGVWKPFFPFGIYQLPTEDYSKYSAQGFNCVMFNQFGTTILENAAKAVSGFNPNGMMSMLEIVPYVEPGSRSYNDRAGLSRAIGEVLRSRYAANVLAYYWDNEQWSEYAVPAGITDEIKAADRRKDGRRQHPILLLQGNSGMFRQYAGMADLAMTYDDKASDFMLQRIEGQQLPWTLSVLSGIDRPENLRARLYRELALGAKGIAFYSDPLERPDNTRVRLETQPVWSEFPKIRRELDRLAPLLREPAWTAWTAAPTSADVTVGTRDYLGSGYLIVSNNRPEPSAFSVSFAGLPYEAGSLIDFFSGRCAAAVRGGSAGISLDPFGTAVYKVAVERCQ
jgi:hypothetical protein